MVLNLYCFLPSIKGKLRLEIDVLERKQISSDTVSDAASTARTDHLLQVLFRVFQSYLSPTLQFRPPLQLLLLLNNELTLMVSITAAIPLIWMPFPFAAVLYRCCCWNILLPKWFIRQFTFGFVSPSNFHKLI